MPPVVLRKLQIFVNNRVPSRCKKRIVNFFSLIYHLYMKSDLLYFIVLPIYKLLIYFSKICTPSNILLLSGNYVVPEQLGNVNGGKLKSKSNSLLFPTLEYHVFNVIRTSNIICTFIVYCQLLFIPLFSNTDVMTPHNIEHNECNIGKARFHRITN